MWELSNEGSVRTLTLNDPNTLNALSPTIIDELIEHLLQADTNPTVRVLIITGAGNAFTSGMNLDALSNSQAPQYKRMLEDGVPRMFDTFVDFSKPLLMAVNGLGTGFGATVLGHADLVIMAESARLKAPFAALANVPEACATNTFPRIMGYQRAFWFLLSGEWMDAQQCKEAGLALEVVSDDEVMAETMRRAQALATFPSHAIIEAKNLMRATSRGPMKDTNHAEMGTFRDLLKHPALGEGIAAIKERRAPDFSAF